MRDHDVLRLIERTLTLMTKEKIGSVAGPAVVAAVTASTPDITFDKSWEMLFDKMDAKGIKWANKNNVRNNAIMALFKINGKYVLKHTLSGTADERDPRSYSFTAGPFDSIPTCLGTDTQLACKVTKPPVSKERNIFRIIIEDRDGKKFGLDFV